MCNTENVGGETGLQLCRYRTNAEKQGKRCTPCTRDQRLYRFPVLVAPVASVRTPSRQLPLSFKGPRLALLAFTKKVRPGCTATVLVCLHYSYHARLCHSNCPVLSCPVLCTTCCPILSFKTIAILLARPLHTTSVCRKREAPINWSMVMQGSTRY